MSFYTKRLESISCGNSNSAISVLGWALERHFDRWQTFLVVSKTELALDGVKIPRQGPTPFASIQVAVTKKISISCQAEVYEKWGKLYMYPSVEENPVVVKAGDEEALLFGSVEGGAEAFYKKVIENLEPHPEGVDVSRLRTLSSIVTDQSLNEEITFAASRISTVISPEDPCVHLEHDAFGYRFEFYRPLMTGRVPPSRSKRTHALRRNEYRKYDVIMCIEKIVGQVFSNFNPYRELDSAIGKLETDMQFWGR